MNIIDTFTANPIGQGVGIIAMLVLFYGLSNKDDSKTMNIIMISFFFWIIHFLIMGIYAGAVGTAVGLVRIFLSMKYKYNLKIFFSLVIITLILGFYTYENVYSILPILASCIGAYGYFFFDGVKLRLFMMIVSMFRLTFDFGNGLVGGIINEVVVQVVLLIAMYKIIHEDGKRVIFIDNLIDTFKKPKFDVGRFISIYDFINMKKISFKQKFIKLFK